MYTPEELDQLAENILEDIDYDIYKEDLEERYLLDNIAFKVEQFVKNALKGVE